MPYNRISLNSMFLTIINVSIIGRVKALSTAGTVPPCDLMITQTRLESVTSFRALNSPQMTLSKGLVILILKPFNMKENTASTNTTKGKS